MKFFFVECCVLEIKIMCIFKFYPMELLPLPETTTEEIPYLRIFLDPKAPQYHRHLYTSRLCCVIAHAAECSLQLTCTLECKYVTPRLDITILVNITTICIP